jgi:NAD(P)-dependent dehydrogenase (short-subunit alcohol dehydrogenase family)
MPEAGVVLVTGAAQRVGRVIAAKLARSGWTVGLHHHRSAEEAETLAREIAAAGGRAASVQADLRDEAAAAALVPKVAAALGPVTALVNNASTFEPDDIFTVDRASWDLHFAVNTRAPLLLSQALARALPVGQEGAIVHVLDQRVINPNPGMFSYAASKAALHAMTVTMAQALGPRGIRVNAVGPGPTLQGARQRPEDFARQTAGAVLGRGSPPEDIAEAVGYLLAARSVTGVFLPVDGGQHLAWRTPDIDGVME